VKYTNVYSGFYTLRAKEQKGSSSPFFALQKPPAGKQKGNKYSTIICLQVRGRYLRPCIHAHPLSTENKCGPDRSVSPCFRATIIPHTAYSLRELPDKTFRNIDTISSDNRVLVNESILRLYTCRCSTQFPTRRFRISIRFRRTIQFLLTTLYSVVTPADVVLNSQHDVSESRCDFVEPSSSC
jgi:hypothetical protein